MKKRYLMLLVSIALLGIVVYVSNPREVFNSLLQSNPLYIGLGISFWFIGALVRTLRWNYLLDKVGVEVPFTSVLKVYVAGMFLSNLSPAKTGDPAKAALLKKVEGKSFSKSLPSVFVGRILDMVILVSVSVVGLFFLAFSMNISVLWVYLAIGIYTAIIVISLYILLSKERTERVAGKIVSIFSFIDRIKQLEEKIEDFSGKVSRSLRKYGDKKTLSIGLLMTFFVWFLNTVTVYMGFRAAGLVVPVHILFALYATMVLLSILTFLPASLGSGDIILVTLIAGFVEAPLSLITTGQILSRLVNYWMYAVFGSILLIFFLREIGLEEVESV